MKKSLRENGDFFVVFKGCFMIKCNLFIKISCSLPSSIKLMVLGKRAFLLIVMFILERTENTHILNGNVVTI